MYKNVALISQGVGARSFVEDHNSVLQVPVHVMQLEVGVTGITPWTSLNQAIDGHGHMQEGHPVLMFSKDSQWMWWWPGLSFTDMLHLELDGHVYHVQLLSTLPLRQLLALLHMVMVYLSGHPPPIDCIGLLPGDGPNMTHHFHHLLHVSSDTKPLKEANSYVKSPLQPHRIDGVNEAVICIK